ncbi:MAG: hypothetical protein AB7V18_16550 [Pyrinomonadaceae bacterium]
MINVENVTHIQLEDDGSVVVFFIGGNMIRLVSEDARAIYTSLNTAFPTRSQSRTTSVA